MNQIRLPKGKWSYDPAKPLGTPGGFGAVFRGKDSESNPVAVKRLHLNATQAAHRELTIAQDLAGRQLRHVMPVLDAGQDSESESYFVIMPIAEESLQDRLAARGAMDDSEAVGVLLDIVGGLEEVNHIVHRDLKPSNILLYDGSWRLADYGIARFVEESTSARTLRDCLSPQYAAPEQWRNERATPATDVYSLGCTAYTVLTGNPPFVGSVSDLKEMHLTQAPPSLAAARPEFQTVVSMMLRKPPETRPSLSRLKQILERIKAKPAGNKNIKAEGLAAAAAAHEREKAAADAEKEIKTTAAQKRAQLAAAAQAILRSIFAELGNRILDSAPNAILNLAAAEPNIRVGSATILLEILQSGQAIGENAFPRSGWDVAAGAAIAVNQANPPHKRAASLWYTRRGSRSGDYRWLEVGYESNPLTGKAFDFEPAAFDVELADRAHSNAMDIVQTSYNPVPIDDEDVDSFYDRWVYILGEAVAGRLQRLPRGLPQ